MPLPLESSACTRAADPGGPARAPGEGSLPVYAGHTLVRVRVCRSCRDRHPAGSRRRAALSIRPAQASPVGAAASAPGLPGRRRRHPRPARHRAHMAVLGRRPAHRRTGPGVRGRADAVGPARHPGQARLAGAAPAAVGVRLLDPAGRSHHRVRLVGRPAGRRGAADARTPAASRGALGDDRGARGDARPDQGRVRPRTRRTADRGRLGDRGPAPHPGPADA